MSEPRTATMTKGEREDLLRLIKQREKTQKSAASQRSAELLADFEEQIGTRYSFDQDEVWRQCYEGVEAEIATANERIAARCKALGIPKQFQPAIHMAWASRGENASRERRAELRRMGIKRIEAIEQGARVQIEVASVHAQTALLASGLTSAAAVEFLEKMPAVETLMPKLDFKVIEKLTGKPAIDNIVPLRLVDSSTDKPEGA